MDDKGTNQLATKTEKIASVKAETTTQPIEVTTDLKHKLKATTAADDSDLLIQEVATTKKGWFYLNFMKYGYL